jgi:hypothetical protein
MKHTPELADVKKTPILINQKNSKADQQNCFLFVLTPKIC